MDLSYSPKRAPGTLPRSQRSPRARVARDLGSRQGEAQMGVPPSLWGVPRNAPASLLGAPKILPGRNLPISRLEETMGRYGGDRPKREAQPTLGAPQTNPRPDPTTPGFPKSDGDGSGSPTCAGEDQAAGAEATEEESQNAMKRAFCVVAYRATYEALTLAEDVAEQLRRSGNSVGSSGALQVAQALRERLPKEMHPRHVNFDLIQNVSLGESDL